MSQANTLRDDVKDYYGEVLQSSDDLKTSACCPIDTVPQFLKPLLANIHDDVMSRFYGCGSPIPFAIEGATVLDLGCGTGRDCYLLSQLVGANGRVLGIDMTDKQLAVAQATLDWHTKRFAYSTANVEFQLGLIEDLSAIADNSIDLVVSNCVINLSANKPIVFKEIFRVLKPGGELYFSDVFADRRLSKSQQLDKILLGECLGGAMYTEDFRRMLAATGVADFRIHSQSPIELHDPEIIKMAGNTQFYSITVRAFKLDLEDRCEDYGQVAMYRGGIEHSEDAFKLDDHHLFTINKPVLVCANTAAMLSGTRYRSYFEVSEAGQHLGLFDCSNDGENVEPGCC